MHQFYLYQFRAPCLVDGAWNNMIYGFADVRVLAPDWLIPGTQISWRRLGKKSKNASNCTKRWSDHEVEQLIDLLEENSFLWDVSNKDYYLRKKRERAYKQIQEKLGTERAAIKAQITTLRQQCWQFLHSLACTTQQVPTTTSIVGPNNVGTCCVRK